MLETTYQDLIEQRKSCKECHKYGLCDDLSLSKSKGNLYQLETIIKDHFPINTLGLWNPANNSNPLTASVLIIGQDFSNAGYFDNLICLTQVNQIESENTTNKKLLKYIELTGIDKNNIYFTNAVLCIKSGSMNAPIKNKWITNCSNTFLKPLITQHLVNLKTIITLGKSAFDAINSISMLAEKNKFSEYPGKEFHLNMDGKEITLYPMFHTGGLGAVNASKVNKNPEDLWKAISSAL